MNCGEEDSPPYISYQHGPYSSSLASSASSSSASVWSDAASQSSDDSSVTSASSDSESSETYCYKRQQAPSTVEQSAPVAIYWPKQNASVQEVIPTTEHRHPRRSNNGGAAVAPPTLKRQSDRKISFVDNLVDSSAQIVEAIWPLSSVVCRSEMGSRGVLPLRTFIQETLRRSRTSYSTLQVALYYLILIKPHVPKHDFTMEQPDDQHAARALQCGRRMFLSALILASKYLQDRNYSTRAWSKISGLNTFEINQNEMAFLLAVNWQLHITDAVFTRWTDIVLKYTPSPPPHSGAAVACPRLAEQSAEWKSIILRLNPELDNIEGFSARTQVKSTVTMATLPSLVKSAVEGTFNTGFGSREATPTPKFHTPDVMEPSPCTAYPSNKSVPALGLLPTPRLTPQSTGFSTPAVSAASYMLCKSSMSLAMAQNSQPIEKWQNAPSSPPACVFLRRSSLATSVSSMSSPESMVSDTSSRSSRSSSISSASSLTNAPITSKLDVQARCRYAKLCSEKLNRTTIASVPESYCEDGPTSSPESYTGPVGKDFLDLSLETPLARRELDMDYFLNDPDHDAARALQELHNHPRSGESPSRAGAKRSRPQSIDHSLQENVREMLSGHFNSSERLNWSDALVRSKLGNMGQGDAYAQVAIPSIQRGDAGRKRVCCTSDASRDLPQSTHLHPSQGGFAGPGMWEGILN
jgi:hypothetical protein